MDLKFSFGASNPLPLTSESTGSTSLGAGSSSLELRVRRETGIGGAPGALVCAAVSADGVEYARAEKPVIDPSPAGLVSAARSVIARAGAELPEPLIGSVTGVVLDLGDPGPDVLAQLGDSADEGFQARTGIAVGTRIRLAE